MVQCVENKRNVEKFSYKDVFYLVNSTLLKKNANKMEANAMKEMQIKDSYFSYLTMSKIYNEKY